MRNALLLGIAGIVLGLCIGFFAGRSSFEKTPTRAPAPTATENPADLPKSNDTRQAVPEKRASVEPTKPTEAPARPVVAAPTGKITGTIVWDDGSPANGVELRAFPNVRDPFPFKEQDTWDVERRAAHAAEMVRLRYAGLVEAVSADGAFSFPASDGTQYAISGADATISITTKEGYDAVVLTGTHVELVASRLHPLKIALTLKGGEKCGAAHVQVICSAPSRWRGYLRWTPETDTLFAPAGTFLASVHLAADNDIEGAAKFEIKPGDENPSVSIELVRSDGCYIKVNQPAPGYAKLNFYLVPEEKVSSDPFWAMQAYRGGTVGIKSGERFFFKGTFKGNYVFAAIWNSNDPVFQQPLILEGGLEERIVDLPALSRDEHIVIRVLSPEGQPVDGARLSASLVYGTMRAGDFTVMAAVGGGEYWLARPDRQLTMPNRSYIPFDECELSIQASHERWGLVYVRIPFRNTKAMVQFVAMAEVVVKISNLPATGLTQFRLSLAPEGSNPAREAASDTFLEQPARPIGTDPSLEVPVAETMKFTRVPTGRARLLLSRKGGDYGSMVIASRDITVTGPTTNETLAVPTLYEVVVTAESAPKLALWLAGDGFSFALKKQPDGTQSVSLIPEGEYLLAYGATGSYIKVPTAGPITFEALPYNAFKLTRYDSTGAIYQAGLRIGDLIVSVNGETAEGDGLKTLREKSADATALVLQVQRAGQILKFTLTGDAWRSSWKRGECVTTTRAKP